jgi:hypothetical protein
MKAQAQPRTFFADYHSRLQALAASHGIELFVLEYDIAKAVWLFVPDAPAASEVRQALARLAQARIGLQELIFLFGYRATGKYPLKYAKKITSD